ncbi:hypothetical protein SELMODRAFT_411996 [Selaginella moellendorffii]|uniref:Uncharacterized protein n=1 Tax=Selaginella moellendorffii TaxID=88036 RepID=D8RJP9_SELML|nr:hypothetical protein SELMODRAFT_411996 [Selaginella moellendorffii]
MMLSSSSFARTRSLLPRANARASRHRHPSVLCFREDDTSPEFFPAVIRELPSGVLEFTPGGRFRLFQQPGEICSTSSNDWGSGNNNNDDGNNRRGWRGHGDNNNSGEKHSSLVAARVLLAFSAFHLGYCIAAWMRKDGDKLGIEFYGVGLGLVCFLATAAVFVSFFVSFGFQRSSEHREMLLPEAQEIVWLRALVWNLDSGNSLRGNACSQCWIHRTPKGRPILQKDARSIREQGFVSRCRF